MVNLTGDASLLHTRGASDLTPSEESLFLLCCASGNAAQLTRPCSDSVLVGPALTKYHKLGGLKQQKFILSQFWRLEVRNQGAGLCSLWNLQGRRLPCLFQLLVWPAILGVLSLQLHHSSLCLCCHMAFSPCVCVCPRVCVCVFTWPSPACVSLCPSYEDTSHVGLRTHPNLVWP